MDWLKKHADAFVTIGVIVCAVLWQNQQMNDLREQMNVRFSVVEKDMSLIKDEFNLRFCALEKDISIIKTVLIMKNMMPRELAQKD